MKGVIANLKTFKKLQGGGKDNDDTDSDSDSNDEDKDDVLLANEEQEDVSYQDMLTYLAEFGLGPPQQTALNKM